MEEEYPEDSMLKLLNSKEITMSPFTLARLGRIAAMQIEFATNRLFAEYFLYLLLAISVVVITIITKKRIDDERLQIGVLKSLGYNKYSIAVSYLTYPIVGSIIGGILGYLIGCVSHNALAKMYLSYYIVPLDNFNVDILYLAKSIFIPLIFLSILCYLVAIFMLRKKPLALLREGSNLKVNIFSKIANKLTSKFPFKQRFKYSLALRSIPKLLIVALTAFFTGMLIVLTLIGVDLMDDVLDKSFSGMKYDYMVFMMNVENEEIDSKSDYILSTTINLDKVKKKNGKVKDMKKEEVTISITGIDTDAKYVDVLNEKGKDVKEKLKEENSIIINSNMKELYGIDVGDTIISKIDEQNTVEYKIVDVAEEYMNMTGYVNRESYSKNLGFDKPVYTMIYSKNKDFDDMKNISSDNASKIATVINFEDLKENMADQMDKFNASIYVVIGFASIMAFVIILVIANIIVEENKKTISLMKVLGYKNKEISSIVLNIYTPVIIIAYLLSIPAMIKFLETVVKALSSDTEMTIPIALSYPKAILGLVGLLAAYYIALAICKRTLNKIPLAVALKRDEVKSMDLIKLENVVKKYKLGEEETFALDKVSLKVQEGEILIILGPSGSGKTTLLNCMSGLEKVTSGKIFYEDKDISKYSDSKITKFRKKNIGFIFQTYNLLENLNVYENVLVGANLGKNKASVMDIIETVGLKRHKNKYMHQLSGGEQQRVSIARAIAKNSKVMFCDEPTGALDEKTGKKVLEALVEINKKYRTTMIIITHNPGIQYIGDRVVRMNSGKIISDEVNKERMDPKDIPWG